MERIVCQVFDRTPIHLLFYFSGEDDYTERNKILQGDIDELIQ